MGWVERQVADLPGSKQDVKNVAKVATAPFSYAVGVDPFASGDSMSKMRDRYETAGVLAGNYFLPGSSLLTSNLASQGSQGQLGSDLWMLFTTLCGGGGG